MYLHTTLSSFYLQQLPEEKHQSPGVPESHQNRASERKGTRGPRKDLLPKAVHGHTSAPSNPKAP